MREWEIGAVENIHGALPYIRFAPILALVGVGVNRIGKVPTKHLRLTLDAHECPLWVISGHLSVRPRMSAFGGKANIALRDRLPS